ncbi:mandelate racemase/muconate lactonizing enzyme family protein, partial [Candidatus Bathyarchaeota archaeon]|nr:mandelate racemase/muconate lactonizing enzyme family protein [Candidatus Bathyarchaeota archaeon]
MKITKIEIIRNKKSIELPEAWRPAWREPDADPVKGLDFSFYKVYTDEGIVGIGPATSPALDPFVEKLLIGFDPFYVERFWEIAMKGRELSLGRQSYGGLEIALWDIIGKALGKPVYKILGAYRDKVMAYAATSQLRAPMEHAKQALKFLELGIKAIKLRMHRTNLEDDIKVVRAVRDAVGDEMIIMVDANQNNLSINYDFWSFNTAVKVARELEKLNVYWLEEPLPKFNLRSLGRLCDMVDIYIAGGEHATCIYELRDALLIDAYDVIQPDIILGNIGITGIRKLAMMADGFGKDIVPHVCGGGNNGLYLAATL